MIASTSARVVVVLLALYLSASELAAVDTLTLRHDRIPSGGLTVATLTLGQAVTNTTKFSVGISGANAAQAPTLIQVGSGQSKVDFPVTAAATASEQFADITITVPGTASIVAKARLTVTAPVLTTLALNRSEAVGGTAGSTVTGTVTLDGKTAGNGLNVTLGQSCSNCQQGQPQLALPTSVRVLGGASTASFTFEPHAVASTKQFTVLASLGSAVKTAGLANNALRPLSLSVSPSTITGSQTTTLTINLNAPAYPNYALKITCTAPLAVTLTPGSAAKSCPSPAESKELSFAPPAGQASMTLQIRSQVTSPTQATILVEAVDANGGAQTTLTAAP